MYNLFSEWAKIHSCLCKPSFNFTLKHTIRGHLGNQEWLEWNSLNEVNVYLHSLKLLDTNINTSIPKYESEIALPAS
jgi:hypothetical protein